MDAKKQTTLFILLLAIIKFALPFFLQHPVYELHRDEFLYLEQGHHLAWGYMEVPPMISWLAAITHVLGDSFFWVKFWPSFFGALTLITSCYMVVEMGGKQFAVFIAALCIMFTAYLRLHFLFQANFLEVFWWSLSAYFIIRFNNSQQVRWLYFIALAFGFAWLSKNSVLFFILGFAASLLLTENRKFFLNKHLYLAGLLAFVIALPNLLWQFNHNWPLLHHMDELRETQLKFLDPVDFLMGQLLMYFTAFFVWMAGLFWLMTAKGKQYRMLAWIYFSVIILLLVSSGKNYYSMGVYPMLFAAGAVALEKWTTVKHRWIRWAAVSIILFLAGFTLPMAMPLWEPEKLAAYYKERDVEGTGMLKWEDQQNHSLPQDFADYLGWKEITEKAENVYQALPQVEKDSTIIYCRHYGLAGALKFYGKDKVFKSKVISDNGSFLHWIPNDLGFKHLIFVGRRTPDADDEVFQHFKKVTVIDSVTNKHSRQLGDKVIFFEQADSIAAKLAAAGLKQMKQEFSRKKL